MLVCEWKLLINYKSTKSNKKTNPIFSLLLNLHLSTFKVLYHYKFICNDDLGHNFGKKKTKNNPYGNI